MDLQRLRYFAEVARLGNFSRAAEACHVSQPSLSQQIKKLEEEVEGPLFLRSRSGVKLSPLGEDFLRHAQTILAAARSAEDFVAERNAGRRSTFRLGAIPTIAPYLLPRWIAGVREAVPRCDFEILEAPTETLAESIRSGAIDFALLSPPTPVDDLCDHRVLRQDELLLTLTADHRLASARKIRPSDLEGEKILLLDGQHCLRRQAQAYCDANRLETDIRFRGSQIETLLRLVEAGFGLTFTPGIAVPANTRRSLVFRPFATPPCHREIRLIWLRQPLLSSARQAVIEAAERVG